MTTASTKWMPVILALMAAAGCGETPTEELAPRHAARSVTAALDESGARVVVDAGQPMGPVMRFERASTASTSSPLPGEATRSYLRSLDEDIVRTWIQTRYVYNNGDIDYNYEFAGSHVGAEDALAFYASTSKSILIALSAYNPTSQWSMPEGTALDDFLAQTLIHYKSRYPNIRYIQVGNEPDANDETMATYYPIYQHYYRAVNAANAALHLTGDDRILIGNGAFTSNVPNMLEYADPFFAAFAADPDTAKKLDFFSFHSYGETNRPLELLTARQRIDAEMQSHGLAPVPVFVTEYGMFGGSKLPARFTKADLVTMQPAAQLTKAFYLYEGGITDVFDWAIFHASLPMKSQLSDVQTAIPYPYGNALLLAHKVSALGTRIAATSDAIDDQGLGTHVLASMHPGQGIAVLVWNYNWRNTPPETPFDVLVKHIPHSAVGGEKMRVTTYVIDSRTNNYYTDPSQTTLQPTSTEAMDYSDAVRIPLRLERESVALIEITPWDASCEHAATPPAIAGHCD
ncbi:MAG TPA: hypothetical protein VF041_00105 [Gemmatimonadaceae bacterium]